MSSEPPAEAFAACLAAFPHMNVHRLGALLRHHPPRRAYAIATGAERPRGLIARVLGEAPEVAGHWRRFAAERPPEAAWQLCQQHGWQVLFYGSPTYPQLLLDDRLPPPVLFIKGRRELLGGRRAAIVGTRNATSAGRQAATELAAGLASAGVHVVSGLARGIDGCAHRGVLQAGGPGAPIAVVASGLDVPYPREHRDLWRAVGELGLIVTEAPPGTAPEAFRFPMRNRLIAAFAEVLVVVESRAKGGSLITVNEATERGVPVMVVPGAIHNRAAAGSNNLLREGAGVAVDASDVLMALSMDHRRSATGTAEQRPRPRRTDIIAYETCAAEPRTLEAIALACGFTLIEAAMALARLEQAGWIGQSDGWFEVMGSPLR